MRHSGNKVWLVAIVFLALWAGLSERTIAADWETVQEGLHLGRFATTGSSVSRDSVITILRVDPDKFDIQFLSVSEKPDARGRSAKKWCQDNNLIAAINAGMYAPDRSRHIGYMRNMEHVNSGKVVTKDYRSVAAFNPLREGLTPFRMFDLDETEMDSVLLQYGSVVQNIRLIKRPAENRWPEKPEKWIEAALGEDAQGNILLIFCEVAFTMYELNEILLALPIDIVCAQHLEGGPAAQFYFKLDGRELDLSGNLGTWPVPNIIGISLKKSLK